MVIEQLQDQKVLATDHGLVSIIMPNYNSAKYVEDTVKSVLAQTYQNWELLFVDDCSTDNSLELVRAFGDDRIKIFQNEKNCGAATSRNHALEMASGRWIAFLDSDDLWIPEKLEKQISYMKENGVLFSYTDYEVIDDNNARVSSFEPQMDVCTYKDILKHNHIGCLTAIYDSEGLGKVLMPTDADKREDLACWLRILKNGEKAYCLHESLAKYKVHSGSVSSNKLKMISCQWNVYRRVEKINIFSSLYYMANWAIKGVLKYR